MALPTKSPALRGPPPGRPRLLGRYHVLDQMGRNDVGPLYLARLEGPKGFQRWSAIRRVDRRHLTEEGYVQRFYERVREGAKLLHPNVTALFDVGEDEGAPWVAMEYLHGERLEEAIGRLELADTPASWEIAARIIADAADGLHAVHDLRDKEGNPLGLLHGDLAPHTLIVTYEGKTKLKGAFEPRVHGVLDPRKVPYAAPEQLFGGRVDARADVFALGVLLWELLAGRRLFGRPTVDETRALIEAGLVPPLDEVVDELPADLDGLVSRALTPDPAQRFESARELSRELESLLVSQGVVARDDDVGRYMRTLFADRYREQEDRLQAAAETTEIFRRSQQSLSARYAAIPDVSIKPEEEEAEETELITAPRGARPHLEIQDDDEDRTTAERNTADQPPALHDTDEIPTMTGPQAKAAPAVPTSAERQHSEEELTLTAAQRPNRAADSSGNSRLIMPSSLESEHDITESAIFVAPRVRPPTPPEGAQTPTPAPPPRPTTPSIPDRPLLPSTPQAGVPSPPTRRSSKPSSPNARPWPPAFIPPPAFHQPPASTGGQHSALSTVSLRAVLFPAERSRRVLMMSVLGALTGAVVFVIVIAIWRGSRPGTETAQSAASKPAMSASAPVRALSGPPPSASIAPVIPPIPTFELEPTPTQTHRRGGWHPAPQHTQAAATTTTTAAPPPPPPSSKPGYLTVMCKPVACDHVIDGGRDLGESPIFRRELAAGKHVLTLRVDGSHAQKVVTVDVPEGETVAIHPDVQ